MDRVYRRTKSVTVTRGPQQPETDMNEFFQRNGLPKEALLHCMEFAKSRLPPRTPFEPLRTQGYCSLTFLAATEPVASIIQFRPESHRLDVDLADDVRSIFGPVAPQTRSLGYLFIPGIQEDEQDSSEDEEDDHHDHGHHEKPSRRRRLRDKIFRRHRHRDDDDDDNKRGRGREHQHQHHYGRDPENQIILHAYSMAFLPGTLLPTHRIARLPPDMAEDHRAALITSLAAHFADAFRNGRYPDAPRRPQTMVASSLRARLEEMSHTLPIRFRGSAAEVLARLPQIEALPWVMTHGDLVPVNVLVDPRHGDITAIIDWAESEYLPFGTGLYALEELLSHAASLPEEEHPPRGRKRWGYYPEVAALRELFWSELVGQIPELREGGMMETVRLAGQMGVLLWCGIAFDDGKLERVVEENDEMEYRGRGMNRGGGGGFGTGRGRDKMRGRGDMGGRGGGGPSRDAVEIAKLDLYLLSPDGCQDHQSLAKVEEEMRLGDRRGGNHGDGGEYDGYQQQRGGGSDFSSFSQQRQRGGTADPHPNSFMFAKADDEENVQEMRQNNSMRSRL